MARSTREAAPSEAADCLEEAIAARIDDGRDIPSPSVLAGSRHRYPADHAYLDAALSSCCVP
jgi:hypothetical protein